MAVTNLMRDNDNTSGSRQVAGRLAEELAARHLEQRGLSVLARNFHCRGGEIDLVCRDGKSLVFVEVRLRRNPAYGGVGASITGQQAASDYSRCAAFFAAHARADSDCRFDCVLLDGFIDQRIEWIRDAFFAD